MTERLSDERLLGLAGVDTWPSCAEAHAMASELIELRRRVVELDTATSNALVEALSLRAELEEHKEIFDLRWNADMRAIARWREANPEKRFILPDHADLCVWLLDQLVAGPVMPEVPSDAVVRAISTPSGWPNSVRPSALYDSIRAALLKEQGYD